MNVSMPIAAVMLDLGFPARDRQGGADPRPHGRPARPPRRGARAAARLPDGRRGRGRDPLRGAMTDAEAYEAQLAYLLERSPFYREKLAGHDTERRARRDRDAAADHQAGAARRPSRAENPFGAHLCAEPHEIVRIYSTSGTTGAPSYIPLTASDLENWIETSARSYAASGVQPGERIVTDLQRRAVRRRRRAGGVRADRPLPRPGRDGQHRAADARDRAAAPRGGRDDARPTPPTRSSGRASAGSTSPARACAGCCSRASRAAASPPSARGSRRAGARA